MRSGLCTLVFLPGVFGGAFKCFSKRKSALFVRYLRFFVCIGIRDGGKNMSENRTRFRLNQNRAPIYEALEQFRKMRVVPFDVPGHKRGRGNPELTAFLGQQCVAWM